MNPSFINFPALVMTVMLTTHIGMTASARADELRIERGGKTLNLIGNTLIEAQDESLLFQADDGALWIVKADEIEARQASETPVPSANPEALSQRLLEELPDGFKVLKYKHYLIAYQTQKSYAKWIAGLYESRLYPAFESFWKKKKFQLSEPEHPLVAIIFASRLEYEAYVQRELGTPPGSMIAYYNLMTNRVAMFDLTADQVAPGSALADDRHINQILQNPRSIPMVATIIHEATHQLMFNRGMQQRLSDAPLWLNEGLALYFEAPDLRSKRGWRTPGKINQPRLNLFKQNYPNRPTNALATMISDDEPFRNSETGLASYADAWAFNHFLLHRRPKEYVAYLQQMSQNKPLSTSTPEQRLLDFQQHFGDDMERLEADFLKYIRKLR